MIRYQQTSKRRGAMAVFLCIMLVPLLAAVALALDFGYVMYIQANMQRVADQAALAGVRDLVPNPDGSQDLDDVKTTVQNYVLMNTDDRFQISTEDIEIGRYDPTTIYQSVDLLQTGIFDTVRVHFRRDDTTNQSVSLFLARMFGHDIANVSVTAAAVLQKAQLLPEGSDILPIAIPIDTWNVTQQNVPWTIYGDGQIFDEYGNQLNGNWGTVDIGSASNSNADIKDQILNGLRQSDLDMLYQYNLISTTDHIDSQAPMWVNGDTGLSAGMKSSVQEVHGHTKLIPIYDVTSGASGGQLDIHIINWGVVEVVDSTWNGGQNSSITVRKAYMFDGDLRPNPDLSDFVEIIEAAYTTPVLVQ